MKKLTRSIWFMKMTTAGFLRILMRGVISGHVNYCSRRMLNQHHRHCIRMLPNRTCSSTCHINDNVKSSDEPNLIKNIINGKDERNVTPMIKCNDLDKKEVLPVVAADKMDIQPFEDGAYVDILAETETPVILEEYTKPALPSQSFTLQSFVQQSPTLQKLLDLGVDLNKVQKRQGAAEMILKLDFDRDIKDKVAFLYHVGVDSDNLGAFLTKNPHILSEDLDSLEVRTSYLKSKKFSEDSIALIVNRAPYFLCFSTESVDRKLGYFQQEMRLTGDEVRQLITKCPQLVTRKISRIQENMYVIHNQLGFAKSAMKEMVLKVPKLLITGKQNLMDRFDYIHNDMDIPHNMFVHFPAILRKRLFSIKERDEYLRKLGLAQYDPKKPGYISLKKLVDGPDEIFCQQVAKTSVDDFNAFLKTI